MPNMTDSRFISETFTRLPAFRPEPDIALVREALNILTKAQRPMIVAGGGVSTSQAGKELLALAEAQ